MSDGMIALGALHYDSACRHCHASPGETQSATVRAMLPAPPHIMDVAIADWAPDELHWIVHNGVKMSGMPAWPAERQDDVWPVVAFLMSVRGMSASDYRDLTGKPGDSACAMCHGENGVSRNPHVPRLDILSQTYIENSLRAYLHGARNSGIMAEAVAAIPEGAIAGVAQRFAGAAAEGRAAASSELARRGRALANEDGTVDAPACRACHGPWPEPLNQAFPSLAGQHAPYLEAQLRLWRDGARGGGETAKLMRHAAHDLSNDDIAALAAYYAGLVPAKVNDTRE
ncbi:MAG: c-type cytochrome [Bauldia litoralis]